MATKYELQQAFRANIRDNQIGGETDGISPEVAADLGYTTSLEELHHLQETLLSNTVEVAPVTENTESQQSPVYCGDCGQPLPCAHGNGRRTFGN